MKEERSSARWLPLLVGIAVAAATVSLWRALRVQEDRYVERMTRLAAADAKGEIAEHLESRFLMLERMARRWERFGRPSQERWEFEARLDAQHYPEFQAIEWVEPSSRVRWIAPLEGNEAAQGLDLGSGERGLEAARARREVIVSHPIDLAPGVKGIVVWVPIFEGEEFGGCIAGIFRVQEMLDAVCRDHLMPGYSAALSDGEEEFYRHAPGGGEYEHRAKEARIDRYGISWRVRVWPGPEAMALVDTHLEEVVLAGGVLMAFLFAWAAFLFQTARQRAQALKAINQELEEDIAARQQAEEAALRSLRREEAMGRIRDQLLELRHLAELPQRLRENWVEEMRALGVPINAFSVEVPSSREGCFWSSFSSFLAEGEACADVPLSRYPWVKQVWETGKPVVVDREYLGRAGYAPEIQTLLEVPLPGGGSIGLNSQEKDAFDAEAVRTVEVFAGLFAEVRQRLQDFEALRRAEQELEQRVRDRTAQLEAANRELGAFSYSVSHDLRAPLRAIDGFSRILMEDCGPQLSGEAQRYLHLVRDNTRQMGHLVDDLLTFSRLGRQAVAKQLVAPAELVRQALRDLGAERQDRRVDVAVGDLPECQADPALLKQVFVNLLGNALKFTRKRETAVIEVGCRQERREWVYFVKDNGVGFDPQYAGKLFEVFQRLHRAEEYEGTGVGLAIVQRIIARHGGRVWAEAAVDQGATFYFTLPGGASHDR